MSRAVASVVVVALAKFCMDGRTMPSGADGGDAKAASWQGNAASRHTSRAIAAAIVGGLVVVAAIGF